MRPSLFILISYFLFLISPAVAQNTFTARIVDAESGDPLPLVSIYISEEKGTLTNFDGEFSIMADSTDLLRITCVGRQSIALYASQLPQVLRMKMLSATLSEVTVSAVEGKLLEVARRMEKAYGRRKYKEAQYFYRQTSVLAQKQDIVEAFIGAKAAVNLRGLEFLTGRHGRLSEAAWAQSAINEMNLHHVLELGPMTKDAAFWHSLVTPLPAREPSTSWGGFVGKELGRAIEYLQKHYIITIDEMDGEDQQLYRIQLRRREDETMKAPIMTGTLYVDRPTLSVLAFDGQVENMIIRFSKGELRSATTIPVNLEFHIDYRYDRKFPEVADLSMQARWGDFQTRTLLFNVEGQKHLKKKKGTHARENMLTSIATVGYDSTFWANNEVVKRTAEEAAIAAGTVDRQQARLDSVATAQAAMPPLERLADRLTRFGQAIPQEKVYVHMDNTCYFLGDTIWFAAYTRRTNEDKPSRISRVLYAELWNHDGYLVERKLVEMKEGRGRGFFALPDTLYSGYFELRAYTRWQLNWGQTEHYHTWPTEYWFYNKAMAKDFFRDYEKLYSRVFPVYDKPKQKGEFYRDMTLRPLRRYFKSAPKPAELRLSLFPEGGNLVAGVPCRVAFEAATSEGEVVEGSVSLQMKKGKIKMKNERGEEVESVETENRGRGTFIFTPEEGEKYEVVFTAHDPGTNGKRETVSQTIKDVKAEGVALQANLDSLTGQWNVTLYAAGQAARQPLGLTVMHEGQVKFFECIVHSAEVHSAEVHSDTFADGNLESQQSLCTMHSSTMHSSTMHSTSLSPGIHQVTVFDSIGHIYADRLFFVTAPDLAQPTLMLSGLKDQYQPYEQVNLDITSSHLMPGQTVSLAVRDAALQDYTFDSGNIMTEMLLASEIKGFVPQPDYFFEADDAEHRRALDLLMLTQGWRRFNWQDMAVKGAWDITHPAEHTQMVTGTVNRYYADTSGFDPNYDAVQAEHAAFQMSMATNLFGETVQMGDGSAIVYGNDGYQPYNHFANNRSYGNRNFGWNLNTFEENKMQNGYFGSSSSFSSFQLQRPEWRNTDYNVLNFKTADSYRQRRKDKMNEAARRYVEEGTVKKDVTVHAEFVDAEDPKDYLIGETQTQNGRFQIDLPRFEGQCIFFLAASDTTKWKKKERHNWVKVDPTDEYSSSPAYPEYYVRLNFPYPRWVKPYTFYQVHNALIEPLPSRSDSNLSFGSTSFPSPRSVRGGTSAASPAASKRRLLTDGTNLLSEVTIRARHGGLRRIDYSKPAYVIDAYNALNLGMDAGLIDYTFSAHEVGQKAAAALIGDMGMERHYDISTSGDSRPGLNRGPLEERRYNLLPYIDKMYIYTDYSPRREGDERYEQDNQPSVRIDLRRYPDQSQRVTYIDRRYILPGFAYQEDFYHPDYQRTPPTEATKDYRRTLYWNPDLQLDANGRAHIHFFTGTRAATLHVDAAGQTAAGDLLFCQ
ncbi:MAG: hypothetical protein IJT75_00790 [Bacteroidaceae bacterium]|nr:hypothetical protein [Bacteroidaceae bacterium]